MKERFHKKVQKPIMKFLFPNEWIGQLIGKGGSIISNVNAVTQAVVKVSQTGDFYPGTQDRCVMCTADEPDHLYAAIDHVTKILMSAQDAARSKFFITHSLSLSYVCVRMHMFVYVDIYVSTQSLVTR